METLPLVIAGIVVSIILVGVLVIITLHRKGRVKSGDINYRIFYILGTTFFPLGIIYEIVFYISNTKIFLILGLVFIALGLSYFAIGLSNKGKWKKP